MLDRSLRERDAAGLWLMRFEGALERVAAAHRATSSGFRPALIAALKEMMRESRADAEARLLRDGAGTACAEWLAAIQDGLLTALYRLAAGTLYPAGNPSSAERLSVVAVGGYGRGTLAPGSDIDLLFLLPYKQTAWGESVVEYLLYVLWDLGFKVGHATRSVEECLRLARTDGTIMTSVLEARYICGDRELHAELARRYRDELVPANRNAFIAQKLAERDQRHHRSGESRYLVEPDVKDGKGGLRDLHSLFWIAKYIYGTQSPADLVTAGLYDNRELSSFLRCEDFLWAVRCHMHFMAGRGDDRLTFDKQSELAQRLGYTARGGMRHVERFMKHYFLIAKEVGDLTRIFCAVLEAREMKAPPSLSRFLRRLREGSGNRAIAGTTDFRIEQGRLTATSDDVFARDPVNLIRLFYCAEANNVVIHPEALKLVRRSLKLIGPAVRNDREANRLFLHMLAESTDPEEILRRMNEAGVLGRFVPEFGRIVAMMQFNMYHHYTIDEHLLRTVGILADIERGTFVDEHPLSSDIFHKLTDRRPLYVAAFLHDIAKGKKERHALGGERIAKELCPRLGLTPAQTETVAWLVRHHLLMSETAQMRDLNDFKTILDFAGVVQSPERLKLLLILTVADIRAVGPGVWNGWKGQLLRTLYFEAEPILSGGHSSISRRERVVAAQEAFASGMKDWDRERLQAYMARHYEPYWLRVDTPHQIAHARMIAVVEARGDKVATEVRTDEFTAITELTVYAPDHPRLLALLTGACAAAGANIVGAQIFTTADGVALDTLLVQREFTEEADERRRAGRVSDLIRRALQGEVKLRDMVAKSHRPKGRIGAFTVEPQVIIDNESSNRFTVIEVNGLDRIGLLYDLTEALFHLNLNIASAQITTFGERAVDVFYVTDLTGDKITGDGRREAVRARLTGVLANQTDNSRVA